MVASRIYKFFSIISYNGQDYYYAKTVHKKLTDFVVPNELLSKYPDKLESVVPLYLKPTHLLNIEHERENALQTSKFLIVICTENIAVPNVSGRNWEDEEIREFISLDPENVHRIFPLLVQKVRKCEASKCMPPILIELGIKPIDVRAKGTARAMSDLVAEMLDFNQEELWEAVQNERAQRIIVILKACCILLLIFGLIYFLSR